MLLHVPCSCVIVACMACCCYCMCFIAACVGRGKWHCCIAMRVVAACVSTAAGGIAACVLLQYACYCCMCVTTPCMLLLHMCCQCINSLLWQAALLPALLLHACYPCTPGMNITAAASNQHVLSLSCLVIPSVAQFTQIIKCMSHCHFEKQDNWLNTIQRCISCMCIGHIY